MECRLDELRDDVDWQTFRACYESQHLAGRSPATVKKWLAVVSWVDRVVCPRYVRSVDAQAIRQVVGDMRRQHCAEPSIKSYLASLKAALRWAADAEMIATAPRFPVIKVVQTDVAGGRAITGEEFDRMLASCEKVVGNANATGWCYLLRGLWMSGLRPRDAVELYWDRPDRQMVVDLESAHRRPKIRLHGELQKGKRDELYPVTPEFARLLLETPREKRRGPVFRPVLGRTETRNVQTWSKRIAAIGRHAKVVAKHRVDGTVKYATAKDLRRSFGSRWAPRLRPVRLMQLMRHQSIETTMRYYVALDIEDTLDELWSPPPGAPKGGALGGAFDSDSEHQVANERVSRYGGPT